jgi:isocitrate dehydrogenase
LVGVDVFIESTLEPAALGAGLVAAVAGSPFALKLVSSRGAQVWPVAQPHTFVVDHFRARFMFSASPHGEGSAEIADLIARVGREHRWMHVEKLQRFDGADGFTKDQGES